MSSAFLFDLAGWLADFFWIASVLLAAAALLRLAMHDPGSRVLLAWGTWLSIAVLAVLIALPMWPRWEISRAIKPYIAARPSVARTDRPFVAKPVIVVESLSDAAGYRAIEIEPKRSITIGQPEILTTIWAAAALLASGWAAVGFWQARRLVRTSKSAPSWMMEEFRHIAGSKRSLTEVRLSGRLSSAVALGALRPRIVLPEASAERANAKGVRAALAHEWAHIRHGDLRLLALERLIVPLLVLHPLFWWLRRSTRLDQELLADAAAAGDKPVEYAEALVAWAKEPASVPFGVAALAMWERPSNLSRRVHMILNHHRSLTTRLGRFLGLAAACLVLGLAGVLSTLTMRPVAAEDEPAIKPANPASAESPDSAPAPATAAEPAAVDVDAIEPRDSGEQSITLRVTLFALDRSEFAETKKQIAEVIEKAAGKKLERVADSRPRSFNQRSGGASVVEIDQSAEQPLAGELRRIDGVKLMCRATIITLDGQEAEVQVAEPDARVIVQREIDGAVEEQEQVRPGKSYRLHVKPRIQKGEAGLLALTVGASRSQPNVIQPQTEIKAMTNVGKTVVIVSSEPYAILVTPTSVGAPAVASSSAPVFPGWQHALPGTTAAPPATAASSAPAGLPVVPITPNLNNRIAALPPAAATPSPIAQPTTPTVLPSPVRAVAPSAAPAVAVYPNAQTLPSATPLASSATGQPRLPTADQKQRKLMELDLAAAKLEVEVAEVELAEAEEIRQKNPAAISKQELRKRQLQVDRAKIQVKRMQVQLGEGTESSAPSATTVKPAGR